MNDFLRDLKLAPTVEDGDVIGRAAAGWFDMLIRAGESAKGDDGRIYTDFIASTASIDRMGDVVDQSTWRLAAWRKNPVILYEHAPPVVGRGSARVDREAGQLQIKVEWDIGEHNPIGTLAGHQHLNGFRSAGSVGFMPGKAINRLDLPDDDPRKASKDTPRWRAGHVFSHNELLEFSSVAVPANRDAVHLSSYATATEDPSEQIRRFVEESTSKAVAAAILDAVHADPEIRKAIRSLIWGEQKPDPLAHLFR